MGSWRPLPVATPQGVRALPSWGHSLVKPQGLREPQPVAGRVLQPRHQTCPCGCRQDLGPGRNAPFCPKAGDCLNLRSVSETVQLGTQQAGGPALLGALVHPADPFSFSSCGPSRRLHRKVNKMFVSGGCCHHQGGLLLAKQSLTLGYRDQYPPGPRNLKSLYNSPGAGGRCHCCVNCVKSLLGAYSGTLS